MTEQQVEMVVRDYIEAWYGGSVERMERALHIGLVKRAPEEEADAAGTTPLREVTRDRMLRLTAEGGGHAADPTCEVTVDDVDRDIACARVVSPDYLDYVHLARTAEGWRIVNVLFHART